MRFKLVNLLDQNSLCQLQHNFLSLFSESVTLRSMYRIPSGAANVVQALDVRISGLDLSHSADLMTHNHYICRTSNREL